MPVVAMKEILDRAFAERYGVAAFNVINDLSIEAVLAAATEEHAPVILQTSGGVGVSAGTVEEDHQVAEAGRQAFTG